MNYNISDHFLESTTKLFQYYQSLGDKAIEQLDEVALFWEYNEDSNSIAILVNHLSGNMLSRWTNFLHADGEKDWRNRDMEFAQVLKTREELIEKWNEGWTCLFAALKTVDMDNIDTTVYIRNQGHTIVEAINRQLGHYAYHVGQIVFLAKMIKGNEWKSLSIPKGDSAQYNKEKFAIDKQKVHFSDEFINKANPEK